MSILHTCTPSVPPSFSSPLGVKALVTLSVMSVMGKKLLDPIFYFVAKSSSHEAFLSIILTTVLLMSFVTQGDEEQHTNSMHPPPSLST